MQTRKAISEFLSGNHAVQHWEIILRATMIGIHNGRDRSDAWTLRRGYICSVTFQLQIFSDLKCQQGKKKQKRKSRCSRNAVKQRKHTSVQAAIIFSDMDQLEESTPAAAMVQMGHVPD